MKRHLLFPALLLAGALSLPAPARADQKPDTIAEKMVVKLARGIANAATCVVEIPKQTVLTTADMGGAGFIIGPLKGIAMTIYRGFIGAAEIAFFLVPQPGYYDPMIEPAYVWEGWESRREAAGIAPQQETETPAPPQEVP
jgi:putative exosortase-associated protein (TIGR04073 family)